MNAGAATSNDPIVSSMIGLSSTNIAHRGGPPGSTFRGAIGVGAPG